ARPVHSRRRAAFLRIRTLTTIAAAAAKAARSGVCHPGAWERQLNAAPLLKTSTRLKNPVSSRRSPGANAASTAAFTSWSAATSAAASTNQRSAPLRMPARFSGPAQVRHAPPAQAFLVHVVAVVPAALALRMRTGNYRGGGWGAIFVPVERCPGCQQNEAQIVTEAFKRMIKMSGRADIDFGLER